MRPEVVLQNADNYIIIKTYSVNRRCPKIYFWKKEYNIQVNKIKSINYHGVTFQR